MEEAEWEGLNDKATTLYQKGEFSKTIRTGDEALKVAGDTFGPVHANNMLRLNPFINRHWK